jgi:hypothetical protein
MFGSLQNYRWSMERHKYVAEQLVDSRVELDGSSVRKTLYVPSEGSLRVSSQASLPLKKRMTAESQWKRPSSQRKRVQPHNSIPTAVSSSSSPLESTWRSAVCLGALEGTSSRAKGGSALSTHPSEVRLSLVSLSAIAGHTALKSAGRSGAMPVTLTLSRRVSPCPLLHRRITTMKLRYARFHHFEH